MASTMPNRSTRSLKPNCAVKAAARVALLAAAACALVSACGGSDDTANTPPREQASAALFTAAGSSLGHIAGGGWTPPPASPRIVKPLEKATIGVGAGARFSVSASGHLPLTYRWHKNGVAIAGAAGAGSSYDITNAVAGSAATYMVRITDKFGSTLTTSASLTVIANGWARLGGRPLRSEVRPQHPSLALCGSPSVAHTLSLNARDELYVSFFDGKEWAITGGRLNATATGSASTPSLDCVNDGTASRPIVAWSEGSGTTHDIFVKMWTGTQWINVGAGALNAVPGTNAVRPTLRTTPLDSSTGTTFVNGATRRTAVAWIENGVPTVKHWDNAWLPYLAGVQIPNAVNASDIALTIELDEQGFTYPPVVAWLSTSGGGLLQQFAATHNQGLGTWVPMGAPISGSANPPTPFPASLAAGRIGIGVGKFGQGRTPVAFWADAATPNNFRSHMYDSANFVNGTGNQGWARYGTNFTVGNTIKSTSFDPREFRRKGMFGCSSFGNLPTFGLAISHAAGFEVRLGGCGVGSSPADWTLLRPAHNVPLEEISVRLKDNGDPTMIVDPFIAADPFVAGTLLGNGAYYLSVWKFYP